MDTPYIDEYANRKGYLRWFDEMLPYPLRLLNSVTGISTDDINNAELEGEFHCEFFDLSDEDSARKYTTVFQRVLDGWYELVNIQRNWDEKTGAMKVWMEWIQHYLEVPYARKIG